MTHYIHHVPGRLRVKTPVVKRNEARAAAVRELLSAQQGLLRCDVNVITGSIVVSYDTDVTSAEAIMEALGAGGYLLNTAPVKGMVSNSSQAVSGVVSEIGGNVSKAVVGFLVERSAAALIGALL